MKIFSKPTVPKYVVVDIQAPLRTANSIFFTTWPGRGGRMAPQFYMGIYVKLYVSKTTNHCLVISIFPHSKGSKDSFLTRVNLYRESKFSIKIDRKLENKYFQE